MTTILSKLTAMITLGTFPSLANTCTCVCVCVNMIISKEL